MVLGKSRRSPGSQRITHSLFAGLQIILPGEVAPAHRHAAAALRFIMEGKNAYTAVAGERTMMSPGDFVITPSMTWHDHGNVGNAPMVWLDGLDMHLVNLMDASFLDDYPDEQPSGDAAGRRRRCRGRLQPAARRRGLPRARRRRSSTTPIHARARRWSSLRKFRTPDPYHAFKMKYINPVTGGWAMPTISTWMSLLPKGFKTAALSLDRQHRLRLRRGPAARSTIGDKTFEWGQRDIFVAPSWQFREHEASVGRDDLRLLRPRRAGEARLLPRAARQRLSLARPRLPRRDRSRAHPAARPPCGVRCPSLPMESARRRAVLA